MSTTSDTAKQNFISDMIINRASETIMTVIHRDEAPSKNGEYAKDRITTMK